MSGQQLYSESIAPNILLDGQVQSFTTNRALFQSQWINKFIPTSLVGSHSLFEFINVNNSGYRFHQATSNTSHRGDFTLEQFNSGSIPGIPLFSIQESTGNIVFSPQSGGALQLNNGTSVTPLQFYNATGSHYAAFQAGNLTSNISWTLPISDSIGMQAMVSNGLGTLSWATFGIGNVTVVSGTANRISVTNGSTTPIIDIASTYVGQTSITTVGSPLTIGTNVLTLGGNLITSGSFNSTFTMTGTTSVTFPTSGTLAVTSQIPSLPLSLSNGGTNANLTASNGSVVYSTSSALALTGAPVVNHQILMGIVAGSPVWSDLIYPNSILPGQLLYGNGTTTISGLATGANGILVTDSGGTPSISSTLPSTVQTNITSVGTITTGTWNGSIIPILYGGTGSSTAAGALTNLGAAPNNAKYIIQTSNASLSSAQVLGSLSTGIVKNTTTTGILSIATAGTDYYSPGNPTIIIDTTLAITNNTSLGTHSFQNLTTGTQNSAFGSGSLQNITSANSNTAYGAASLFSITTTPSDGNSAFGYRTFISMTSGSNNVGFGYNTAAAQSTYTNCTFLGTGADASVNSLTNSIAIGYLASVAASNTIVLGNSSHTTFNIPGLNLGFTSNTIRSTNTNGNILITPNGTGITSFTNNVGLGTSTPHSALQFSGSINNRLLTLFEITNNPYQYYGFGIQNNTLVYNVAAVTNIHAFYAATSSSASQELMRITATGTTSNSGCVGINVGATPSAGCHVIGGVQNVSGEDTCFRAQSASNSAKIELDSTGGTGRLYEIRSGSTGIFDVVDRTGSAEKLIINTSGMGFGASAVAPSYDGDCNGTFRSKRLLGNGNAPTFSVLSGAGTGATASISGCELSGKFSLTLGTLPAGGDVVTFTLSSAMPDLNYAPLFVPSNQVTTQSTPWVRILSTTQFNITFPLSILSGGSICTWHYTIIGST